ncbi:hypothetical protein BJF90_19560 [Pseudonocardia sp. CNS-004]|nr:hypothetical protein BJF90_19560 [Pseudonocardia sp. CNS-004]
MSAAVVRVVDGPPASAHPASAPVTVKTAAASRTLDPIRSTICAQLPSTPKASTPTKARLEVRATGGIQLAAVAGAQARTASPTAKGTSWSTATLTINLPTGMLMSSPRFAQPRSRFAVIGNVRLPMAARRTCSTEPVTTSPFWIIAIFAPNAPGDDATRTSATRPAVDSANSSPTASPSSGTTTRFATRTSTTSRPLRSTPRRAGMEVRSPAESIVATTKAMSTVFSSAVRTSTALNLPGRRSAGLIRHG